MFVQLRNGQKSLLAGTKQSKVVVGSSEEVLTQLQEQVTKGSKPSPNLTKFNHAVKSAYSR